MNRIFGKVVVLFLFALLLLCVAHPADAAPRSRRNGNGNNKNKSVPSIQEDDHYWYCHPDFTIALDEALLRSAAKGNDVQTNQMLLAHTGVPFLLDMKDNRNLRCFQEVLLFRNKNTGVCLPFEGPRSAYYFLLARPHDLEERFGAARLAALQHLALPNAWAVVDDETAVGDRLAEAEALIAALPSPDPPGTVTIPLPASWRAGKLINLPLADVQISSTSSSMPEISFDAASHKMRAQRHQRVLAKLEYDVGIAQHDDAIREEAAVLVDRIHEEVHRARETFERERRSRDGLAAFIKQREERQKRRRQGSHTSSSNTTSAYHLEARNFLRVPAAHADAVAVAEDSTSLKSKRNCRRIASALMTLVTGGAVPESDTRVQRLRALAVRDGCADSTLPPPQSSETTTAIASHPFCATICSSLGTLTEWQNRTGESLTVAQIMSLLLAAYMHPSSPSADSLSPQQFDTQHSSAFLQEAHQFISSSGWATCACAAEVTQSIKAELHYFDAMISLLDVQGEGEGNSSESIDHHAAVWHPARAVASLFQAVWYGSPHAAGSMSTMREHGIFMRQHGKASLAMLVRSKHGTSSYFFKKLLASRGAEHDHHHQGKIPPEALLRQERFYAVQNSWSSVDAPYASKQSVSSVFVVGDQHLEDEDEDSYDTETSTIERLTDRITNQLTKAHLFIAGFKGVKRNIKAAECELLSVLRKMGYGCDMELLVDLETNDTVRSEKRNDLWGLCAAHSHEMRVLRSNRDYPRVRCPWWSLEKTTAAPYPNILEDPLDEKLYEMLQEALVTLGYVYLLDGQRYEMAAMYARLSVQLAHRQHHGEEDSMRSKLAELMKEMDNEDGQEEDEDDDDSDTTLNILESDHGIDEQLVTLAVSSLVHDPAKAHVAALLRDVFSVTAEGHEEEEEEDAAAYTSFFLLLAASSQWRLIKEKANLLELTYNSLHGIDPFALMALLVQDMDGKGRPASIPRIHELAASVFHPLFTVNASLLMLPAHSDTTHSYAARLLHFSRQHIRASESSQEMMDSGLAAVSGRLLGTVDDVAPHRTPFSRHRMSKQHSLDVARFSPLLHATDLNEYLCTDHWTVLQRVGDAVMNSIYYLFTETEGETLLRRLGVNIVPPPEEEMLGAKLSESAAPYMASFLDLFQGSAEARGVFIAAQLLSTALESGYPTGFSLVFEEAGREDQPYLVRIANYLAEHVWGPLTAEMWVEQHVAAQWHSEKPQTRHYTSPFSINARSTFRYSPSEARQELMALVDRWRAKQILVAATDDDGTPSSASLAQAVDILAQCTGHVVHHSLATSERYYSGIWEAPPSPYDGMQFPAGDVLCATELLQLLRQQAEVSGVDSERVVGRTQRSEEEYYFSRVVGHISQRLAAYFGHSLSYPADALPETDSVEYGRGPPYAPREGHPRMSDGGQPVMIIEPWNHEAGEDEAEQAPVLLGRGEGTHFNARLHRLTGIRWYAALQEQWARLKRWVPW